MDVLRYTKDEVAYIHRYYDVNEKWIQESVEILKKWTTTTTFAQKSRNKFRIEKTKKKLDAYYTLKNVFKEYYQENNEEFVPSKEVGLGLAFPRLTPKSERIVMLRFEDYDPDKYDLVRTIKYVVVLFEIIMRNDYAIGDRLLIDFKGLSLGHLKKLSISEFSKLYTLYSSIYSGRPLSIDILNTSEFVNVIVKLIKLSLPEKVYSKIKVHKCNEDLYEYYPKSCLPSDYGGDLESVQEMKKKWDVVFDNNRQMLNEAYHHVSAEHLRVGELPKGDYFGVDGTFKKLNLD